MPEVLSQQQDDVLIAQFTSQKVYDDTLIAQIGGLTVPIVIGIGQAHTALLDRVAVRRDHRFVRVHGRLLGRLAGRAPGRGPARGGGARGDP